jgi:hypothetical protein
MIIYVHCYSVVNVIWAVKAVRLKIYYLEHFWCVLNFILKNILKLLNRGINMYVCRGIPRVFCFMFTVEMRVSCVVTSLRVFRHQCVYVWNH